MERKRRLLFICTANVSRSPTAAQLFENSPLYEARSAGTTKFAEYPNATIVSQQIIDWADMIFVMSKEEGHLSCIRSFDVRDKEIFVLDIPNIYHLSIPEEKNELLRILQEKLRAYLPPNV